MKKKVNFSVWGVMSIFLVLFFLNPGTADAQILKNLGKKVEKKAEDQVNRRVERRIDRAMDKGFDKVEEGVDNAVKGDGNDTGQNQGSTQSAGNMPSMGSIFGGSSNVTLKDTYNFAVGVSYEITTIDGSKQETLPGTTIWLSEDEHIGMSTAMQDNMFMVLDGSGNMISFMENEKRYIVMGSNLLGQIGDAAVAEAEKEDIPDYTFNRVGSENVQGYPCEIWELKSDDMNGRFWVTQALGIKANSASAALSTMMRNSKTQLPQLDGQATGIMLKTETVDKDGNQLKMTATEIHKDGKSFPTAGYQTLGF